MKTSFHNRHDAGIKLAAKLQAYKGNEVVIYALPRGGVAVAAPIAWKLGAPLDLVITRKIGHPAFREYAVAAVAGNGTVILSKRDPGWLDRKWLLKQAQQEREEISRRSDLYLTGRDRVRATGKVAILVDDGMATGLTMHAAVQDIQHQGPSKVVVAVPVASTDAVEEISSLGATVITLMPPVEYLGAVGGYYERFPQVSDREVVELLKDVNDHPHAFPDPPRRHPKVVHSPMHNVHVHGNS